MADPLTLTAVGAAALTEGIKFLYGQAGEALKQWRERKAAGKAAEVEPVDVQLPTDAFAGQLERPQLHLDAVGQLEQELRDLRAAVADYAQDIDGVDPSNDELLQTTDALRQAMEAVYRQRITFSGEPRPPSGPLAAGEANVDEVLGYVAGLRAKRIISGSVAGRITAKRVDPGGQAIGLEVGTIGSDWPDGQKSLPPDRDDSASVEHGDEARGSGWPRETAMSAPRSGGPYTGGGTSRARQRYLKGQCPDSVLVGKPFSLLVSIVLAGPARQPAEGWISVFPSSE